MNLTVNIVTWAGFGNPLTPLNVSAGGIVINDDTNGNAASSLSSVISNGECAKLSVTQTGYHPYNLVVDNIYEENRTITILVAPIITDINSPDYNRPFPFFFVFQDPCSFKVDYYNASSFPGDISWYLNNEEFDSTSTKGTFNVCAPGEFQLKVRGVNYVTTGGACPMRQLAWDQQYANIRTGNEVIMVLDPIEDYLALDTQTNVTEVEYRPSFSISADSPVDQLEEACCYTREETVTVTATTAITRPGSTTDDYNYEWSVIDPDGLEVYEDTTPITQEQIAFRLDKLGVYTVNVNLVDMHCNIVYPNSFIVETCNFIVFDYVDCNTYTISNKSSATDVTYSVTSIEGISNTDVKQLGHGESETINFTTPSLYFVTVTRTVNNESVDEIYVLNNYCVIEECFAEYILDILCEDTRRCEACPDAVELNQFSLLFYTYFMELNKEYGINNFYSGLEDSQLERLGNIAQVMERILEFCSRRNCSHGQQSSFDRDIRPAGSETLDWAGKGSNKDKSCNCNPQKGAGYYNTAKPGYCNTCNGKV